MPSFDLIHLLLGAGVTERTFAPESIGYSPLLKRSSNTGYYYNGYQSFHYTVMYVVCPRYLYHDFC